MVAPLIFVSHSAKEPESARLLGELVDALAAAQYTPLGDFGSVRPGQQWEHQLDVLLGTCHAAVILFSIAAVQRSDWVLRETTNLLWRRGLDPNFFVLPVFLPGTHPDQLAGSKYRTLGIDATQSILASSIETAQESAALAARIIATLNPLRNAISPRPIERFAQQIAARLQTLDGDLVTRLYEVTGLPQPAWAPFANTLQRFICSLLTSDFSVLENAVDEMVQLGVGANVKEVIQAISPFLWLPTDAATALRDLDVAAVDGELVEFTGRSYLRRAWWRYPEFPCAEVPGSRDGTAQDLVDQVCEILGKQLLPNTRPRTKAAFNNELARRGPARPVFILHGPPAPTREQLERLKAEFPLLRLLVFCGAEKPQHLPLLLPLLGPSEREADGRYQSILNLVPTRGTDV